MKKEKSNHNKKSSNTDDGIQREIYRRLQGDSKIDVSHLKVEVKNGSVILKGKVDTEEEKNNIENVAASVKGVINVENHLHLGIGVAHGITTIVSQISPTGNAKHDEKGRTEFF